MIPRPTGVTMPSDYLKGTPEYKAAFDNYKMLTDKIADDLAKAVGGKKVYNGFKPELPRPNGGRYTDLFTYTIEKPAISYSASAGGRSVPLVVENAAAPTVTVTENTAAYSVGIR